MDERPGRTCQRPLPAGLRPAEGGRCEGRQPRPTRWHRRGGEAALPPGPTRPGAPRSRWPL